MTPIAFSETTNHSFMTYSCLIGSEKVSIYIVYSLPSDQEAVNYGPHHSLSWKSFLFCLLFLFRITFRNPTQAFYSPYPKSDITRIIWAWHIFHSVIEKCTPMQPSCLFFFCSLCPGRRIGQKLIGPPDSFRSGRPLRSRSSYQHVYCQGSHPLPPV